MHLSRPQFLGPSWDTLGTLPGCPRRAPSRPKRSPARQNASQKQFFTHFFRIFFPHRFSYRFVYAKVRNDLYRNLENKRFASTGARFSRNRFFRLATQFYRKMTSKTLRFDSQHRRKSHNNARNRQRTRKKAKWSQVTRRDVT